MYANEETVLHSKIAKLFRLTNVCQENSWYIRFQHWTLLTDNLYYLTLEVKKQKHKKSKHFSFAFVLFVTKGTDEEQVAKRDKVLLKLHSVGVRIS